MAATVEKYLQKRTGDKPWYRVRWRDEQHKSRCKRGFERKRDADAYAATVNKAMSDGTFIDPQAGRIPFGYLAEQWLEGKRGTTKIKYYDTLMSAYRNHVEPVWADRPIASIRRSEIQTWVSKQSAPRTVIDDKTGEKKEVPGYSPSVVLRNFGILKGVLQAAVSDGLLAKTPCTDIDLPKKAEAVRVYLTPEQLLRLADAAGDYRALILTLGICGLRWGEAAGLKVGKVDFERKRLKIDVTWIRSGKRHYEDVPKTWERREVPVPPIVLDALRKECEGKNADDLVFPGTSADGHLKEQSRCNRGWYAKALSESGVPSLTCHDLRHTAASIAVHSGCNVKALQRMLGHKRAAMTLDRYAGLFDSDLDVVAANVEQVMQAASVKNGGHVADTLQEKQGDSSN